MADKIISATLKVNTGTSAADIGNVNKQLDNTNKTLGTTEEQSKQTTGSFSTLKDGLGKLPGPLGAVNQGVNTVSTSLKALAANPIVLVVTLLVAALVALYKAFASTESGAEKIEQIFSGLGAIVTVIRDRILALAGAVISFFKGDFKAAIDQTKAAVTGVGDAMVNAYNKAADATRNLQEAEDELNRSILVNRAKLERDLARSKELITDTTASYEERKAALDLVTAAQEKQAAIELANAKKTLLAKYELAKLDSQNSDKINEYNKAQADFYAVQTQQAADERNLNKQGKQIEADRAAQAKQNSETKKTNTKEENKLLEDQLKLEKELADRLLKFDEDFNSRVQGRIKEREKQAEAQKKQDEDDQKYRDGYQKEIDDKEIAGVYKVLKAKKDAAAAEKKIEEEKLALRQTVLQVTSNLLGSLSNLLGKQTIAGKAFAIAQTTIDTYQSAIASYKSLAGIPVVGPALGFAAAAAAIVNGLATVKQIVSVKVPGGAGDVTGSVSGTNPLSTSPAAPVAPTQQNTAIDPQSIQGIGNAVSGRSYVVSQDITHDQDRNERLNRAARLGN